MNDLLLQLLISRTEEMDADVDTERQLSEERAARADWLWYELVLSYSTNQTSRGAERMFGNNEILYNQISFEALNGITNDQKSAVAFLILSEAHIRFPFKKSLWIADSHDQILDSFQTLEAAQQHYHGLQGAVAKKTFLRTFPGIGREYAKNIPMDLYDPDFLLGHIKLDSRIKKIVDRFRADPEFSDCTNTEILEQIFAIGQAAGIIDTWTLDRLLFRNIDYFVEGLNR